MPTHNRRLKVITFTIDGTSYECQVQSWKVIPGREDGDRQYAFCPDGGFTEETDSDYTLELVFWADWTLNGISRYLTLHDNEIVEVVLDHHPDIPGEHVRWTGDVRIKAPEVGGEARATERTEITLQYQADPVFTEVA